MNVLKDFEKLFALFDAKEVKALIVGGYAFAFHARPRYTQDLDILVEPTPENARRILEALEEFGFGALALTVEDFTTPGVFIQLGHPPGRVDLLNSLKEVHFEEAWERRVAGRFGDQSVFYLAVEDLIRNKQAVGRPQDRADVAVLKRFTRAKGKSK
jgi:hypothetical protein